MSILALLTLIALALLIKVALSGVTYTVWHFKCQVVLANRFTGSEHTLNIALPYWVSDIHFGP